MGLVDILKGIWTSIHKLASISDTLKEIQDKQKNIEDKIYKMELENASNSASLKIIMQAMDVRMKKVRRKK